MTTRATGLAATIAMALALSSSAAKADATDLFTAGLGTGLGMSHATQIDASSEDRFVSELSVHAKLLRIVGLQFAYNFAAEDIEAERLVFHSRLRLAAQIFFIPLDEVGVYMTGGLGAESFTDLASITAGSNSYQAGLGAEVYIDDHFTLAAEYMMVIPGVRSIQETVLSYALKQGALTDSGTEIAGPTMGSLSAGDFVSPANFLTTVGVRYYF